MISLGKVLSTSVRLLIAAFAIFAAYTVPVPAQTAVSVKAELGSRTAKNGFRNEDDIKAKFLAWRDDQDAREWLAAMGHKLADIQELSVVKPHDEKADIEVTIKTKKGTRTEGISIKLVSSENGFNQIDKRWLSHYAAMWKMPTDVQRALKLFVGETPPTKAGRSKDRMFLDEIESADRKAIIAFFESHKTQIVSDLFAGSGPHAARWVMVASRASANLRWSVNRVDQVIKFYSEGPIVITSGGNLKIGRITMQRKGGDAGRDTARMLQFKIDPALLIN